MEKENEEETKTAGPGTGRWWVWATVLSSIPMAFLADSAVAWLRGWAVLGMFPDDRFFLRLMVVCAVAPFAPALLPAGRRLLARAGPLLASMAVSVFLAFLAGEGVVRIFNPGAPIHRRPPGLKKMFLPDTSIMPGVKGPDSFYTINSFGVRGTEPPERSAAHRILCIGGSTTECLYLDDSECWPAILEKLLNANPEGRRFWVGDVGFSGYTTDHHLELLNDAGFIGKFDTLLFLCGINDAGHSLAGLPPLTHEVIPFWKNSLLMRRVRDRIWPRGPAMRMTGEFHTALRSERKNGRPTDVVPDLSEAVARYASNISAIARRCSELGVGCVFLTQPVLWREGLDQRTKDLCWGGQVAGGEYLTLVGQLEVLTRFNDVLNATAAENGAACIDLASMSGRKEFFFDDCHYTEAGAWEVARLVAKGLSGRDWR